MSVTLHTDVGDIKMEIFCEVVPKTAENFLGHCAKGTYDGTRIHRNIKEFMIQMGDPTGTGKGGESIWGGMFDDEIRPALRHNERGIVSMANTGPNKNGSQFFIIYKKQVHLDGRNTVFGRVLGGFDILDKLEQIPVDKKNRPIDPIFIRNVTIHANPIAAQMVDG